MIEPQPARDFPYELLNERTLFSGGPPFFVLPEGRRGFRDYTETPLFLAVGSTNRDFWRHSFYWFISDRMKTVLERVDPDAFVFLKCRVQLPNGADGPVRWLCDVVRVLDALDEKKSSVEIGTADDGTKVYQLFRSDTLIFKDDPVGSNHIFRMMYFDPTVICDEEMRLACKAAGLSGLSFRDCAKKH